MLGWIRLSVHPRSRASSTRRRAGLGRPPAHVSTADRFLYCGDVTSVRVQGGGWGGREGGRVGQDSVCGLVVRHVGVFLFVCFA